MLEVTQEVPEPACESGLQPPEPTSSPLPPHECCLFLAVLAGGTFPFTGAWVGSLPKSRGPHWVQTIRKPCFCDVPGNQASVERPCLFQ